MNSKLQEPRQPRSSRQSRALGKSPSSDGGGGVDQCARRLLEVVPLVMRTIRAEIRSHRYPEFSLPQFRAMAFIARNRGASLSAVSEHIGLTLPAASRLVDGLVIAGCVTRVVDADDRRKMLLDLTPYGAKRHQTARESARHLLAGRLGALAAPEVRALTGALDLLSDLFRPAEPVVAASSRRSSPKKN